MHKQSKNIKHRILHNNIHLNITDPEKLKGNTNN